MWKRKSIAFLLTVLVAIPMIGFCFMLIEGSGIQEALELIVFAAMFVTPVILSYANHRYSSLVYRNLSSYNK